MPISIIEIDVQDEAFKEFQVLFAKYKSQVDGMPAAWSQVNQASEGAGKAGTTSGNKTAEAWAKVDAAVKKATNPFDKLGAIVRGTVDQVKKATTAQQKFNAVSAGAGKGFGVIAKSTKSMAVNIKDATIQLLKWASLTSVFAGLAGAGGLFGISRLAQSASQSRRESQGLGITPGEHEAAKINFQKLVDVDAVLARINEARNDVTKRWAFSAAGLSPAQIDGKSNAEVMKLLIPLLKSTNERAGGTQQAAHAHGLLEFTDMATLTRLKAVQQQEIDAATKSYEKDRAALAVADQTQAAWQNLDAQLRRAGVSIENQFIVKLASLTGPLTKLSDAFAHAVKVFLDSPKIGKWLNELGAGIEHFSKYLISDSFGKDVDTFLDAIDSFAGALYSAGKTLGKVLGLGSEKTLKASEYRRLDELEKVDPELAKRTREKLENPEQTKKQATWYGSGRGYKTNDEADRDMVGRALAGKNGEQVSKLLKSLGQEASGPAAFGGKIKPLVTPEKSNVIQFQKKSEAPAKYNDFLKSLERQKQLPDGLLWQMEAKESSHNPDAIGPATKTGERAKGPFQFMDAMAKQYNVSDPFNREQAATGAASAMHDLLGKYNGDLSKALAGYNWGQGNVDKLGMEKQPSETRDYVKTILAGLERQRAAPTAQVIKMPAMPNTMVTIQNNTGGNAVVIASQIAQ